MSGPEPVGQRPEVAFRFQEPLDALGIRVADIRQQRLLAGKAFEPPFNASQLAPVKVMLEGGDDILDIAGNAAQFPDGGAGRLDRGRVAFQRREGGSCPGERIGDPVGIARHVRAPGGVELQKRVAPSMDDLGEAEQLDGVVRNYAASSPSLNLGVSELLSWRR